MTDEEYVPEDVTLKVTHIETNTSLRSTLVRGMQNVRGSKTTSVRRETVIHW